MAYRTDRDIEFIGNLPSENLADLVYVLTHAVIVNRVVQVSRFMRHTY